MIGNASRHNSATIDGDRRLFRAALRELSSSQKRGDGEPAYLRWINRPLGRLAAAIAYKLGLSPNAVSAISFAFSLAGIAILAVAAPTASTAVIATGMLVLGYVLDSADGQLARLSGMGSAAGEWLDHVLDAGRIPLFHLGLAVSFFLRPDSETLWQSAIALAFVVVSSVRFFAHILSDKLTPKNYSGDSRAPAWHSFAKLPLDVGFVYLAILALPMVDLFSGVYTALFVVTALMALTSLRRKYISLKTL